jgi:hypothetical protein
MSAAFVAVAGMLPNAEAIRAASVAVARLAEGLDAGPRRTKLIHLAGDLGLMALTADDLRFRFEKLVKAPKQRRTA